MNILLVNIPSRKGQGGCTLPLGLLYLGGIIEREGHRVRINDPYMEDVELKAFDSGDYSSVDKDIEEFKPSIIGFGGISTSYGRTKRLGKHIREKYPHILQIAGGPLSSVYDLLLNKAGLDAIFHSETEVSFPIFLSKFGKGEDYKDTPGISYLLNGNIIRNTPAPQVENLDTIPFPAYHLIDMPRYFHDIQEWVKAYKFILGDKQHADTLKRLEGKRYFLNVITSRGCTHRCLFCYRHVKGVRQHSVDYVIRHVKYLKEKYGIDGVQFADELFNAKPEWVFEFCDAVEKEGLDIFYIVGGARIDKINEKMLSRLKETGCIEVDYGHESGSDTILKEYRKGITADQNRQATQLTSGKYGMNCAVQLVIGSPSENPKTIGETIKFLKDVDAYQYSINYLIPLPETPIWKYVEENKLISDVEAFLDQVAEEGGRPLVNLTHEPDNVWRNWIMRIRKEMKLHYYKKKKPGAYYFIKLFYVFQDTFLLMDRKHRIKKLIPKRVKKAVQNFI